MHIICINSIRTKTENILSEITQNFFKTIRELINTKLNNLKSETAISSRYSQKYKNCTGEIIRKVDKTSMDIKEIFH